MIMSPSLPPPYRNNPTGHTLHAARRASTPMMTTRAPVSPAVGREKRVAVNRGRGKARPVRLPLLGDGLGVRVCHLLDDCLGLLPLAETTARLQCPAIGEGVVNETWKEPRAWREKIYICFGERRNDKITAETSERASE